MENCLIPHQASIDLSLKLRVNTVWHILTVMLLPNENETSYTKKEQYSTKDGLPFVCSFVHLCIGLVKFDTVHCKKKVKASNHFFPFSCKLQATCRSPEGGDQSLKLTKQKRMLK